jgi:hypothetical protein
VASDRNEYPETHDPQVHDLSFQFAPSFQLPLAVPANSPSAAQDKPVASTTKVLIITLLRVAIISVSILFNV